MSSPTERTLKYLRANGWTCAVVEKRIPHTRITKDLFGCIDILAIKPGHKPLGVQATSGSHHAHRRTKSLAEPRLLVWMAAGCDFEVWSWAIRGRGKERGWTLRAEKLHPSDVVGVQVVKQEIA